MNTILCAHHVMMEMCVWLVAVHDMRAGWSTAGMEYGELCVMMAGYHKIQMLCVVNLDTMHVSAILLYTKSPRAILGLVLLQINF